ncbi:MAG: FMN-binding glutamate synthase family protein [Methanocellales archaeon]|nr:FMN-binding glutamate synthase family protein [Methanocellales archaeon]MDD3420708.1 FMN-binding glutamate synthase family protein [Methanocellales archaeon]MDD4897879.1 FMN-binding glutamate synthase family protein [Methanocellales archaeon]MDD5446445.1 FMN-binding glutamate synthase family protein [Methanocellales archaeon]
MADIYANARSTTGTRTRVTDINPTSGMCPICIRNCQTLCEIGLSAFRGREVLYPSPEVFGESTSASNKDYALDWSHFQILVDVLGAKGIEADPDKAIFEAVDIKTEVGGVPLKIPVLTAGLGSTAVAKKNWDSLAIGAALTGTIQVIGENVCGMDPASKITGGKVVHSEDLQYRVEKYREFWDGKHGDIVVQTNVEDQRLGVDTYALSKLGVNIIERKWGQGAKAIGGEVRIQDIGKAKMLKQRGYIVLPDPEDISVQEAFRAGVFRSFERHSRVGMPEQRSFVEDVEWLRGQGAKKVFLKTGAYRPSVVAFTMKVASEAKIDVVTFDGAGGGTGMSPVPMMNECSTPTVYLEAQVLKCMELLMSKGRYVPDIVMAGGFVNETQMFKSMAMSNLGNGPCVKAIAMARAPITAALKASYFTELAVKGELPLAFAKKYGETPEQFFIAAPELKSEFGDNFQDIPVGAIGVYTYYYSRLGVGLKQLLAATRKWRLDLIDRGDIASLSDRASKVTIIPTIEEIENDVMESILS